MCEDCIGIKRLWWCKSVKTYLPCRVFITETSAYLPATAFPSNRTLLFDRFFALLFFSFLPLQSSKIARISFRSLRSAMSRAVSLCLFLSDRLQPASSRMRVSFLLPIAAAMCNAVSPFLFCSATRDFAEMRIRVTPACPYRAAVCRAVSP